MTDEDLQKIIPQFGIRVLIRNHLNKDQGKRKNTARKETLLNKLRKKIDHPHALEDQEVKQHQGLKLIGNNNAVKKNRII